MTPVFIALSAHVQGVKNVNRNMGTMYRVSAVFKKALHNTVFSLRAIIGSKSAFCSNGGRLVQNFKQKRSPPPMVLLA